MQQPKENKKNNSISEEGGACFPAFSHPENPERKTQESIRINRRLSNSGLCSRREADRLIQAGRVFINGRMANRGDPCLPTDEILVDGKPLPGPPEDILLLFYKPRGLVCSTKRQGNETTVTDYLAYPSRIYPVGRLDKESEGLLLMTNKGDLVNPILRARERHEKEYLVTVDKALTPAFLKHMAEGVEILGVKTRRCRVEKTGRNSFRIILTQGLNRQIRRMCEVLGYRVLTLKRIRIMHFQLGGLRPGEYREATQEEKQDLYRLLGR